MLFKGLLKHRARKEISKTNVMSSIKENVIKLGTFSEKAKELVDNLNFENAS
jgi:hypothetical protein